MSTATLAGQRVTNARVYLPASRVWWAEVSIDQEIPLVGRVELKIADLVLSGTIMSGGPSAKGRSSFRIAGGAGLWGKTIPSKSYANDAGVKASTVITDAANACGETLDATTLTDTRLGPGFTRKEGSAAWVLEKLVPAGWYVGEDGVTRIGKRPALALSAPAQLGPIDRARGTVTLAAESIATIVPGVIVDGLEAVDVVHELEPGSLRSTIWGAGIASSSRELAALKRIIEQLDPDRKFRGVFEYRVVTQEGERLNLQPVRVSTGMPDLGRAKVRPGIAGARADVQLGSRVLVIFVDQDPARYEVIAFEDAEGAGFLPDRIDFGKALGVVLREGDTLSLTGVQPGPGATGVQATVTIGLGLPPEKSRVHA